MALSKRPIRSAKTSLFGVRREGRFLKVYVAGRPEGGHLGDAPGGEQTDLKGRGPGIAPGREDRAGPGLPAVPPLRQAMTTWERVAGPM